MVSAIFLSFFLITATRTSNPTEVSNDLGLVVTSSSLEPSNIAMTCETKDDGTVENCVINKGHTLDEVVNLMMKESDQSESYWRDRYNALDDAVRDYLCNVYKLTNDRKNIQNFCPAVKKKK